MERSHAEAAFAQSCVRARLALAGSLLLLRGELERLRAQQEPLKPRAALAATRAAEAQPAAAAATAPVYLRYMAPFGLCNQLSSHIHALALGLALEADGHAALITMLLPPAWTRTTFNYNIDDTSVWGVAALVGTLLDVQGMTERWRREAGIELLEVRRWGCLLLRPAGECCRRQDRHASLLSLLLQAATLDPGVLEGCVAVDLAVPLLQQRTQPLAEDVATIRAALLTAWRQHGRRACSVVDRGSMLASYYSNR